METFQTSPITKNLRIATRTDGVVVLKQKQINVEAFFHNNINAYLMRIV